MFRCYHCRSKTVLWDNDFSFEDCALDGDGLVQFYHCETCGAIYEVRLSYDEPEETVTPEGRE